MPVNAISTLTNGLKDDRDLNEFKLSLTHFKPMSHFYIP